MLLLCKLLILFISLWHTWSRFTLLKSKKKKEFGEICPFFESIQIGQVVKKCAGPRDRGLQPVAVGINHQMSVLISICLYVWFDKIDTDQPVWPAGKNVYSGALCNAYISAFSSEPSLYYSSFTLAILNLSAQVHTFTQDFFSQEIMVSLHCFTASVFLEIKGLFFHLFSWLWTRFHLLRTFGVHLY